MKRVDSIKFIIGSLLLIICAQSGFNADIASASGRSNQELTVMWNKVDSLISDQKFREAITEIERILTKTVKNEKMRAKQLYL